MQHLDLEFQNEKEKAKRGIDASTRVKKFNNSQRKITFFPKTPNKTLILSESFSKRDERMSPISLTSEQTHEMEQRAEIPVTKGSPESVPIRDRILERVPDLPFHGRFNHNQRILLSSKTVLSYASTHRNSSNAIKIAADI
ncbi:hypothetical protein K0M31_015749 [Melipona bicolor]|uniref:Uncharacterized protein n=1 Tax=Melipona bicolor TaxID=60889 RepID=A0AA40FF46_9HYME|nr:hypothetical protein K0M31_015749 [Melipona bicolor]